MLGYTAAEWIQLISTGGILPIFAFYLLKNQKETNDKLMHESSIREEKLMNYLNDKNKTDSQIVASLQNMETRMCSFERILCRGEN